MLHVPLSMSVAGIESLVVGSVHFSTLGAYWAVVLGLALFVTLVGILLNLDRTVPAKRPRVRQPRYAAPAVRLSKSAA